MTFQRKLLLGFLLMVLPVALIGTEAIRSNRDERQALEALGKSMSRTRTYAELETAMFNQSEAVWRFLSGMDPKAKNDFTVIQEVVQYWQQRWQRELKPEEMGLAREIAEIQDDIVSVSQQIFSLYETGEREAAYALAERELKERLLPALTRTNREVYRRAREYSVQGAFARLEDILRQEQRILLSIVALSLLVGLLASFLISRGLARPIRELQEGMAAVGRGGLDHPLDVGSRDEIGDLAREFARMTEKLKQSRQAMARLNADLEAKIAQLEDAQAQLIQSEKLASIGEMSAAVAHGLRNPLASLRAAAQVALHQMRETPAAREHLETIIEEVDRLDRRIGHLLSFSRPAPYHPMREQLAEVVGGVLPTFRPQLEDRAIELQTELPPDLPEVRVDPMQLEQALVEVLSNAIDAMPGGGRLAIRAYSERRSQSGDGMSPPDRGGGAGEGGDPGACVVLEIADSGSGIPEQVLPNVCDPFFTTRPEGTGLGLAIAKRYVDQNGGSLEIVSRRGAGTTVRVRLPAADGLERTE